MRSCPGRPRLARAVGVSTILLMLWVLVLAPVTASGSATGGAGDAGTPATIPGLAPRGNPNAAVAVSVILSQAPALATPAPAGANPKAARADAGAVVAQQGAFAGRATSLDPKAVKVVSSQSQLLNRVTLNVPRRLLGRVQSLPGVVKVFPEQVYHAAQDVAPLQIDAVAAAEASPRLGKSFASAGQGVKIGIIDTGVDPGTPFLTDQPDSANGVPGFATPLPAGFPKGVTSFKGAPVTTRKVIAARSFCDDTFDAILALGACGNPGDPRGVANGHGTHVAGIAAGNYHTSAGPVWGNVALSGEAPAAWIGDYKVLDHNPSSPNGPDGTSSEIAAGVEQAVLDGMDVLNLSLGGGGEANDVAGLALEQAATHGVVVAVAAGNSGPGSFQVGSPGAEPDVISVAATVSRKSTAYTASVGGAVSGTWEALNAKGGYNTTGEPSLPPTSITYGGFGNYKGTGFTTASNCPVDPTPTGVTGTVLVIERGCSALLDKAHNAAAAGAAAVIIVSQSANPATSFATESTQKIPAYMTNRDALVPSGFSVSGQALVDASKATHPKVSFDPSKVYRNLGGELAGFSSPGPLRDESLKPDVAAPGTLILSASTTFAGAGEFDPSHFTYLQGTSMASPQVAGSAALLLSAHPDWTPADVKSALQTTGHAVPANDAGSVQAATWQVGGGQIDDLAASEAGASASPSSLSFGKRNVATQPGIDRSLDVSLASLTGQPQRYAVSVAPDPGNANPGISVPSSVVAGAGRPESLRVSLKADGGQTQPRIRYSGMVKLTPEGGGRTLQLPYLFTSVSFPVPAGSVLYVDDSGHDRAGADYDNPAASPPSNPASKLAAQIAATGHTVRYWDRLFYGEPSLDDLKAASSVVWSFESGPGDFVNLTNNGTLSGTELETMRAFLDGGGRLDVVGEIFAAQALAAYAAITPTGTVVPDNFATFDSFLQDRFGFAVLNGGAALDPLGAGIEIAGVTGSVIGDGIAGRLGPSLFGGRDTISLVGPAAPTFRVTSPPPLGSDILGDRTSYEQSITAPGQAHAGRPGRTTFETFSTADLPGLDGAAARSRILDYLEDDVKASASTGRDTAGAQPAGGNEGDPAVVSVDASSSRGTVTQYVYDFGDGSPLVASTDSAATHRYRSGAHRGPVAVQVTDSLGHSVVVSAG